MNTGNRFSSENLLMSVCGHMVLIALMLTSFVIVVDRAKLVAPDRIEILEIDLDSVHVSGDETILHNVNADVESDVPDDPVSQPDLPPEPEPTPVPESEPIPLETPSLVNDTASESETPAQSDESDATEQKNTEQKQPQKKKKTVVRVNREVVSLDRTLTVSVVDALRVAMTRCWVIDTTRNDIGDIRAVAHLTMRRNGTVRDVWFESAARAETDSAFAYVLDTIRSAINTCQPFKMLPPNEFDKWQKIQLTFYPTQGKVM